MRLTTHFARSGYIFIVVSVFEMKGKIMILWSGIMIWCVGRKVVKLDDMFGRIHKRGFTKHELSV